MGKTERRSNKTQISTELKIGAERNTHEVRDTKE